MYRCNVKYVWIGCHFFRMVNQHEWNKEVRHTRTKSDSVCVCVWEYESVYYSCIGIVLLFIFPFLFDSILWYAWSLELDQNRFSLSFAFLKRKIFSRLPFLWLFLSFFLSSFLSLFLVWALTLLRLKWLLWRCFPYYCGCTKPIRHTWKFMGWC